MNIEIKMKPVQKLIADHGLNTNGDIQKRWTALVNRRITRYMPFRSGMLATKSKYISSPTEITVASPYARYMYYGKVMADPVTGAAGFRTKDGQWRSRKGIVKVLTERNLNYDTTKNDRAGPLWDKRLIAEEMPAMLQEMQNYINRLEGK